MSEQKEKDSEARVDDTQYGAPLATAAANELVPPDEPCAQCVAHELKERALQDSIDGCARKVAHLKARADAADAELEAQATRIEALIGSINLGYTRTLDEALAALKRLHVITENHRI